MGFVDPVRVCTPCATVTKQEEDFFNTHLKLLFAGNVAIEQKCRMCFDLTLLMSLGQKHLFISISLKDIEPNFQTIFVGVTFNVSTSTKTIESPLSDVIQNDLQPMRQDRASPSLSSFSADKDKLGPGNQSNTNQQH